MKIGMIGVCSAGLMPWGLIGRCWNQMHRETDKQAMARLPNDMGLFIVKHND
jgi:hypothetical protein